MTNDVIKQIQKVLTCDLLKSKYLNKTRPFAGHCYHASEALYYLLDPELGFKPHYVKHEGDTHWFLRNAKGRILDPTVDQFKTLPKYERGKACGYLTKYPSLRARMVMERVEGGKNVRSFSP